MNIYILPFIASLLVTLGISSAPYLYKLDGSPAGSIHNYEDLVGTWQIDLRPTPDAAPYLQLLTISKVEDGRLYGTFYNSPIQYGKINTDWGRSVVAFVTQDAGGNDYYTVLEVDGFSAKGTTHSPQRNFLAVWTGKKQVEE